MDGFVERLLLLSERGAVIARRCREEEELFRLLVEEKKGDENTKLSGQDFKTLADVLVQETIRSLLGEEVSEHECVVDVWVCGVLCICMAVINLLTLIRLFSCQKNYQKFVAEYGVNMYMYLKPNIHNTI